MTRNNIRDIDRSMIDQADSSGKPLETLSRRDVIMNFKNVVNVGHSGWR
jgi:hypothetical protein